MSSALFAPPDTDGHMGPKADHQLSFRPLAWESFMTSLATPSGSGSSPAPTLADLANAIRVLSIDAVEAAKSGHPGLPMGMADVATVLFGEFLKFDPSAPECPDRDRFV